MSAKILVTYASRAGTSAEVADSIAKLFASKGFTADVKPVKNVTSLDGYKGVVIGSGIYMGSIRPDAKKFLEKNRSAINAIPSALFVTCMTRTASDPEQNKAIDSLLQSLQSETGAFAATAFAGRIDPSRLNFLERFAVKMVKSPVGDHRKWDVISAWAEGVADTLAAKTAAK